MSLAGVFLLVASAALAYNVWPSGEDPSATLNNRLESIGAQTPAVGFGVGEKQVLGAATSSTDAASESAPSNEQFTSYTVKSGDTLFNISQAYGIKWDLIAQFNSLSEPYILHSGQTLKIPQATTSHVPGKIYTIAKGDTLARVAKNYNITVDDIIAVNPNLQKSDLISIGQVIRLP